MEHKTCDYNKIRKNKIATTPSGTNYWLTHRGLYTMTWYVELTNAYANGSTGNAAEAMLFKITNGGGPEFFEINPCGVRPIVVLEYGVLKKSMDNNKGTGTKDDPYILTKIN